MKSNIIASDLDGCVINFINPLAAKLKEKYNYEFDVNEIRTWELSECTKLPFDDVLECILEIIETTDKYETYPYAADILRKISIFSPPIIFITSRRQLFFDITKKAIENSLKISPDKFYLIHEPERKSEIVNNFGCTHFIEDRKKFAEEVADHSDCKVILLDRPWNQHCLHLGVKRVYGWPEINKILFG